MVTAELTKASRSSQQIQALRINRDRILPDDYVPRELEDAIVIPLPAVIQSARGAIVYVAQDGKAVQKPVQLLAAQGDDAAVSGIEAGDRVVVDGRQNLRPDIPVAERKPAGDKTGGKNGKPEGQPGAGGQSGQAAAGEKAAP